MKLDTFLAVGEIVKPHGIKGDLKVKPLTNDPERFFDLKRIRLKDEMRALYCLRVHQGFAYVRIEGVDTAEQAEQVRGELVYVHRGDAAQLPEDTDFICDLIGCIATDENGNSYGVLTEVLQNGGVDVYVFSGPEGIMMIPALKRAMVKIDTAQKQIILNEAAVRETAVFDR